MRNDRAHRYASSNARRCAQWSRRAAGFTLIEIAVVFVLIGLIIGAVLKGGELLTNARARGLLEQQSAIQSAYYGFLDRFRALPGDYANASATIPRVSNACGVAGNLGAGNGNGRIELANGEHILVWDHLSKAGFLKVEYTCTGNDTVAPDTTPRNTFNQYLRLAFDAQYAASGEPRHNLKTGNGIPSDILAEMDRKADDGDAIRGIFRGSAFTSGLATDDGCWDAASGRWTVQAGLPNCGGAILY